MYLNPHAFFADQVLGRNFQVVEEQLVGLVVDHVEDRLHSHAGLHRLLHVDDEDRQAFGLLLHLAERRRAGQQDHQVRVLHPADPHLLPVDDIAVALLHGGGLELCRVGAGGGFGHAHRLQPEFTGGDAGQILLALFLGAVPHQRVHVVHLAMTSARVAARPVDLLHDDGSLGEAQSRTAIAFRDQSRHPPCLGQRVDELFRITPSLVDLAVIFVWKFSAKCTDCIADFSVFIGVLAQHSGRFLTGIRGKAGSWTRLLMEANSFMATHPKAQP